MIDIDHFKRFNDDFGHRVGYVTLQKVAAVLKEAGRETALLYRYGGDEAMRVVERVRRSVEKTILTGERMEPVGPVTVSDGLAVAPANGSDFTALLEAADRALYRSKEDGRNRTTLSEEKPWEETPAKTHAA